MQETVKRLSQCAHDLYQLGLPARSVTDYFKLVDGLVPEMMSAPLSTSMEARQQMRRVRAVLANSSGGNEAASLLAEVGPIGERVAPELRALAGDKNLVPMVGYLRELAFLARTAGTIRTAIGAIRRIVGALKRYSRLDEAPLERVDVEVVPVGEEDLRHRPGWQQREQGLHHLLLAKDAFEVAEPGIARPQLRPGLLEDEGVPTVRHTQDLVRHAAGKELDLHGTAACPAVLAEIVRRVVHIEFDHESVVTASGGRQPPVRRP